MASGEVRAGRLFPPVQFGGRMSVEMLASGPDSPETSRHMGMDPLALELDSSRAGLPRHHFQWMGTGGMLLRAQLQAIYHARRTIRLEVYIFTDSWIGRRYRTALTVAAARGVQVRVLIDAVGSMALPTDFFAELEAQPTAEVRRFNELNLATWSFRDHRKLVVVDEEEAFVGGCNIGMEYTGDGVHHGWRDGGLGVRGPVVKALAREFDAQWRMVEETKTGQVLRRRKRKRRVPAGADVDALFIFPGLGPSPLRDAISADLRTAHRIAIVSPYFLPPVSLRRRLMAPLRRGARVQLLTAGKTDVPLMQLASRSTYRPLLKAGVEIYEYQPQVLHAKLLILDDIVYIGSSNLDPRSLRINFEIMLRVRDAELARQAWAQFEKDVALSRRYTLEDSRGHRTWWRRLKQKFAYFVLAYLDPRVAEGNLRRWMRARKARARQKT